MKNVIFDIGRVLLDYYPEDFTPLEINPEFSKEINEKVFYSDLWPLLDKGTISEEEAEEIFVQKLPHYEKEIRHLMKNWQKYLTPIPASVAILKSLKGMGIKVFLLSNFIENPFEKVYSKYDFLRMADGMVISSHVKLIKPDKEIYTHLLEKYSLIPEESIFIDDNLQNVKAAEELGIKGILFISPQDLKKKLEIYFGNIEADLPEEGLL